MSTESNRCNDTEVGTCIEQKSQMKPRKYRKDTFIFTPLAHALVIIRKLGMGGWNSFVQYQLKFLKY
jgi:hypothetical protein